MGHGRGGRLVPSSAVLPLAKQYINSNTVALVAAIGGIFIVTLIIVSIITVKVSDLILDSHRTLDRTLGFVFGAARGDFLICVIGWVFLELAAPGQESGMGHRGPHASGSREHRQQPHRHAPGQSGGASAATAQPRRRTAAGPPNPIRSARGSTNSRSGAADPRERVKAGGLAIAPSPPHNGMRPGEARSDRTCLLCRRPGPASCGRRTSIATATLRGGMRHLRHLWTPGRCRDHGSGAARSSIAGRKRRVSSPSTAASSTRSGSSASSATVSRTARRSNASKVRGDRPCPLLDDGRDDFAQRAASSPNSRAAASRG